VDSPLHQSLSRRQALGILAAPLTAPLFAACRADRLFSPLSLDETTTGQITLIGAGDQHALAKNYAHRTGPMVKAVLDADPNAWAFALGDLVPNGTAEEYLNYYHKAWGAFRERTCFLMGNHDRKADPYGNAYYDYVGEVGGTRGQGYHAKTLGAWRCYFLNSEGLRDEQTAWLAADLPNWSGHHIMAMWHSPLFASVCAHNGRAMTLAWKVGAWWKVLQDYGAEFVVSGHVHRWERYARMLRNGSVSDMGIRQFIVGTGGVKNMDVLTVHPHSESQVLTRGVVRFDLHTDRYEWTLTDLAGVVRDSGVQMCRKVLTPPGSA
jgi:acid phosphatase type 7